MRSVADKVLALMRCAMSYFATCKMYFFVPYNLTIKIIIIIIVESGHALRKK